MLGSYFKIRVGQLLLVERSFSVKRNHPKDSFSESVKIKKGSVIEIRFPFEWNFRTECNTYCNCNPELLIKNCSFYGVVNDDVRSGNNHKLADILSDNLFIKPCEYELVRRK